MNTRDEVMDVAAEQIRAAVDKEIVEDLVENVLRGAAKKPIYRTYEDFPVEDLLTYAGIDCIVTSDLARKLIPTVSETPSYTFVEPIAPGKYRKVIGKAMSVLEMYEKYITPAHEFIIDIELNGIKYDVAKNREVKAQMEVELAEMEDKLKEFIGYEINFNSGADLRKFLYEVKGYEVLSFTKTNEPSTDGDAIKELAEVHTDDKDMLLLLARRADIASLYRTFVKDYVEDFVKPDGRIHPSYNLHGTGSFRITGSDPNLTQLPRPKHGYNIRRFYTVDEGNVFIALDFSSAEVKILGALCKDENLLKAIREGLDFHAFSASNMFGIDYQVFMAALGDRNDPNYKDYKEKRQVSKVLTFSILNYWDLA